MSDERIAVVGLGYVGLPLAMALAEHGPTTGYDRDRARIADLRAGRDRTGEVGPAALAASALVLIDDPAALAGHTVFIVTVPTPVDAQHEPDLSAVLAACRTIAPALAPGALVVLESTVYPGVTEEIVGPTLAALSGLAAGRDFFLGYAPERINPGDRAHALDRITKVVAGQTPEAARRLARIYRPVSGAVYLARDLRTAEAAKAIENAQRDINIAFVNEVALICQRLGLSVHDVLEAARTKWNFLDFQPGLVGGHCIGVDPYYLAYKAKAVGHHPQIILAGRAVNDAMPDFIAAQVAERLTAGASILALGLTFKENVPDLRNSKAAALVLALIDRGFALDVHDPLADPDEARAQYGLALLEALPEAGVYEAVLGVVPHRAYGRLDGPALARLVRPGGLLADVKGAWRHLELPPDRRRWTL